MNEEFFSIRDTSGEARMKNISPTARHHFHGLTSANPDTFIFEFIVVCRTYDYTSNEQKMKLFPSTFKDVALHWFMGILGDNITTWAQMQQAFKNKHMGYYRSKETK